MQKFGIYIFNTISYQNNYTMNYMFDPTSDAYANKVRGTR